MTFLCALQENLILEDCHLNVILDSIIFRDSHVDSLEVQCSDDNGETRLTTLQ